MPIRKPDFIFTSTDGNANKPRTKTTITNRDDYSLVNDLPIDDKDRTDIGIVRWRLNLRNFRFIAQFKSIGNEYEISDIRRSDFSKLIMHNMEQLAPFCAKIKGQYVMDIMNLLGN